MGALVVRTALRDLLAAGAEAGDGHHHPHREGLLIAAPHAAERGAVVHQTLHAGHRCTLHHEQRELDVDMGGIGLELVDRVLQKPAERRHPDHALAMEDLDEARHVRALEVLRQGDRHAEVRDRVLQGLRAVVHLHRMREAADADLVDGEPTLVLARLDIIHRSACRAGVGRRGRGRQGDAPNCSASIVQRHGAACRADPATKVRYGGRARPGRDRRPRDSRCGCHVR